ncbi:homeobox protein CHOX-CAD-like [Leptodactylus fuscus]|uniref:homeobox protein CHOX-CAD-like n=1 Tax=Leptodactylus fuscus TaxID=238119 RepID=UPI003F4EBE36
MNITCRHQSGCKEGRMYPLSVKAANNINNHTGQNYGTNQPYFNYVAYHHVPGAMDNQAQPCGVWGSQYGSAREDWSSYSTSNTSTVQPSELSPNQFPYNSPGYNSPHPSGLGILHSAEGNHTITISPGSQSQNSYEWMRKTVQSTSTGKTRTKEKYRVVYTDHQRLELEKEFHYSRYITIRRKAELAANLSLSERQIKIWFQNRRAKERKIYKKKMNQFDATSSLQSDSSSASPNPLCDSLPHAEMPGSLYQPPQLAHNLNNGRQPNSTIQQVTV